MAELTGDALVTEWRRIQKLNRALKEELKTLEPVTKRTYKLLPTSMEGQSLLTIQEPGDLVIPTVSVQIPTGIAIEIITCVRTCTEPGVWKMVDNAKESYEGR